MHSGKPVDGPATPGLVFDMMQAHQRTAALKAAIDLDVFRAVGDGPGDVASIARHTKSSERGIRILCDFLAIYGVLVKENGSTGTRPPAPCFSIRARPRAWLQSHISERAGVARALRSAGGDCAHGPHQP